MRNLFFATVAASVIMLAFGVAVLAAPPDYASMTIDQLKELADSGSQDAMLELGERLVQGQGVEQNSVDGLKWFQKAADAGKREAFARHRPE